MLEFNRILCFPSDCAVWQKNPAFFCKRTNKNTKNNDKNKTTTTGSSTSTSSSGTERDSSSSTLICAWWPLHSKTDRNCQQKALWRGFLTATNGIRACPNFQDFPEGCPLTLLHPYAFRLIIALFFNTTIQPSGPSGTVQ